MATNKSLKNQLQKVKEEKQGENKPQNVTLRALLDAPGMRKRFDDILGKKAPQFISSILSLVNSDKSLQEAEPMSIIQAALIAATLDLPINKNLGYAWIIPYKNEKTGITRAQFQLGWKGYVQLALRTGQYRSINVLPLYEGQLKKWNPLTEELEIDFDEKKSDAITHYCGYFELVNGFRKTVVWTRDQIIEHAKKYSKSYHKANSPWQDQFEAMALKTVVRNMLSKWGILSVEMQDAYVRDIEQENLAESDRDNVIDLPIVDEHDEVPFDQGEPKQEDHSEDQPQDHSVDSEEVADLFGQAEAN